MTKDWFQHVVELSGDSIKELSLEGIITFVNSHGLERVAVENKEYVLNRHWTSQWPDHVHPQIEEALAAGRRGEPAQFEAECTTPRGVDRHWLVSTTPLKDEFGNVTSLLAVNRDITEGRLAQAALVTLKNALQGRLIDVKDGNTDAFGEQLQKTSNAALIRLSSAFSNAEARADELDIARAAQRLAESAAKQAQKGDAIGQLLAGMVHDLNNVLQAASGAIELVRARNELVLRDHSLLGIALNALTHGTTMSKRLLGFASHHPYAPEMTNLCELATNLLPLLQQAAGSGVQLECHPDNAKSTVLVDPNTLERALMNLVINARDASPNGGAISVVVTKTTCLDSDVDQQRRAGNYVTISVVDQGEGIAPEVRDRLFEAYFTTKPSGKGTGLGLAQVYGAVRQANGFIEVISQVGHGSTFTMAFPEI